MPDASRQGPELNAGNRESFRQATKRFSHAMPKNRNALAMRWALGILYALAIAGFPLAAAFPSDFGEISRQSSVYYRLGVVGLSLVYSVMAIGVSRPIGSKMFCYSLGILAILLWIVMYLHFNVTHLDEHDLYQKTNLFFWGVCIIPTIPFLFTPRLQDLPLARQISLFASLTAVGLISFVGVFLDPTYLEEARLGTSALNPISFGHLAVSTILLLLAPSGGEKKSFGRVVTSVAVVALIFVIMATAARGPLAALIVCVVCNALVQSKRAGRAVKVMVGAAGIAGVVWAFVYLGLANMFQVGAALDEFRDLEASASAGSRLGYLKEGWSLFLSSPIVGGNMVTREGVYPHNIIIEALMATGVTGGMILAALGLKGMHSAWVILKAMPAARWVALLYVQALVGCMFSGSLYSSPEFWIMSAAVVGAKACGYREVRPAPKRHDVKGVVTGATSGDRKAVDHLSECRPAKLFALVKGVIEPTFLWRRFPAFSDARSQAAARPRQWMARILSFGERTAVVATRVRPL